MDPQNNHATRPAEEALRESEARLNLALEAAQIGTWFWGVPENSIFWDDRMHDIYGLKRGSFAGTYDAFQTCVHPDDIERVRQSIQRSLETDEQFDIDYRVVWPDGSVHFLTARAAVFRDPRGKPLRLSGMCLDITHRKQAEGELVYERYLLHSLMDSVPDSIYFKDLDSRFLRVNRALAERFGFNDPAEALGKTDFDLFTEEHARPAFEDEQEIIRTGRPLIVKEEKETWPDGRSRWVSTTKLPFRDARGGIIGTLGISRDVTAQKQTEVELQKTKEAAEAANRAKSEFLANMSHEIRTPMNGIIGMTALTLDTELNADQREFLTMVKVSADALLSLLNDILDFSKIEAGKLELDPFPFLLRDSLEDTTRTLAHRAEEKGLELVCHISPDVPDSLIGDAGRLRQIVVNLIGNGIKFTEQGEVVVDVSLGEHSEEEVELKFAVSDSGIGIPADKIPALFQAFSQADCSTTRKYGGTGLGLAISRQLAELMGGVIWIESTVGKGSTFHFSARFKLQKGWYERAALPSAALVDLSVLIVDDNAVNRRLLIEILTNWGMNPTAVAGAAEALAVLEQALEDKHPFPLVLVDCMMPEIDGFMLAETIKLHPELTRSTVMMLSSAAASSDRTRCRELGVAAYLTKPIKQSDLLNTILTGLGNTPLSAARPAAIAQAAAHKPLRVLLAEDNSVNQKLVMRLLEKRGHSVCLAKNGYEAIAAFRQEPFDLVLMDMQMPGMDGFEATAALRAHEKQTGGRNPIIALTAHAMKGDRERCLAADMDDYLTKPLHAEQLWAVIDPLSDRSPVEPMTPGVAKNHIPPGLSSKKVFDVATALQRVNDDRPLLQELIKLYLDEASRMLEELHTALVQQDFVRLHRAAHTLKGAIGLFESAVAFPAAEDLERMAKAKDLSKAVEVYAVLEAGMDRLRPELVKFLEVE